MQQGKALEHELGSPLAWLQLGRFLRSGQPRCCTWDLWAEARAALPSPSANGLHLQRHEGESLLAAGGRSPGSASWGLSAASPLSKKNTILTFFHLCILQAANLMYQKGLMEEYATGKVSWVDSCLCFPDKRSRQCRAGNLSYIYSSNCQFDVSKGLMEEYATGKVSWVDSCLCFPEKRPKQCRAGNLSYIFILLTANLMCIKRFDENTL